MEEPPKQDDPKPILEQYPHKGMERDLALMLQAAGAGDASIEALGRNHPSLRLSKMSPETLKALQGPPLPVNPLDKKFNGIEQARQLKMFMERGGYDTDRAAKLLGCSRGHVNNMLRLLDLPQVLQDHITEGRLRYGHARAIAKMPDPEAMADLIIKNKLSVRAAETIARRLRYTGPDGRLLRDTAIPNTEFIEGIIEDILGCPVNIRDRAGRGTITLKYKSPKTFKEIIGRLSKPTQDWKFE